MTDDPTTPPPGVLATAALAEEAAMPAAPVVVELPPDPVDPNYNEPMRVEEYQRLADLLAQATAQATTLDELHAIIVQQASLIRFLLPRVELLELALLPIASQAMVLGNARMCLIAAGRPDEPCGGHWVNQVTSTHLAKTEGLFFNAADALGRRKVQRHLEAAFQRLQESNAAAAERDAALAAGAKIH